MSNQVATRGRNQVQRSWELDEFKEKFAIALPTIQPLLPAHVPVERFKSMVITELAYNEKLWVCSIKSIIQAVRDAADLGLSLNKNMKEADILPIWSPNGTVAQLRPRYEGLMKLARQSGAVVDIWAHVVYENDVFEYEQGLEKNLVHKPAPAGKRGEMLQQAFCCWKSKDGNFGFEVIEAKRINRAKSASEGYKAYKAEKIKSTPWVDDEEEMIRKTAVRAGSKYMPKSTESDKFMRALALSDDTSFDDDDHIGAAADPVVIPPPKPTRQSVRETAETTRKQNYEMDREYRGTMSGEGPVRTPPLPPHDEHTGEVDERQDDPAPDSEQANAKSAENPHQQAPDGQAAQEETGDAANVGEYDAIEDRLSGLITRAATLSNLNKIIGNNDADLTKLKASKTGHHDRVMQKIDDRRKWFAK